MLDEATAVDIHPANIARSVPIRPHLRLLHGLRKPANWLQLVRFGIVSEDDLASLLAEEYRLAVIDLTSIDPTSDVLRLVPHALARRHVILPIGLGGSTLSVAIADPTNLLGLSEVKLRSGCGLNVALAPAESLSTAIEQFYGARARAAG